MRRSPPPARNPPARGRRARHVAGPGGALSVLALGLASPILLSHCAMPGRPTPTSGAAASPPEATSSHDRGWLPDNEGSLDGLERRQKLHVRELVRLIRATPRAPVGGQRLAPAPPGTRPQEPYQARGPTADRPAAPGPGATAPIPSKTRRSAASARPGSRKRCRRVCRHVAAICHAARRICSIASVLAEPSADAACARARDRCAAARGLARTRCATCPRT